MDAQYKLMLVDDEPWALTGMEEIIDWKAAGFEIVARCSCGQEAILQARLHQPDAVITDIRMPDISGIQLIREIHAIPVPAECVVVSAYSDFEVAREAIRLAAVHYLLKPLSASDVWEAAALLRDKLDHSQRPRRSDRVVLHIDRNHPVFPAREANKGNCYLLVSDSAVAFAAMDGLPDSAQPVEIDGYAGLLISEKLPSLPPETGESLPADNFADAGRMIDSALASLDGGFRFAPPMEGGKSLISAADIQLYLWKHLDEEINLKQLAGAFYLTETYICDLFKKQVGETILSFLRHIRIHRASRLLVATNLTLKEIAFRCGYSDYSYFGRHFKAETGLPPELYRKQSQYR